MGVRMRKSIKLGPGVRLNVSHRGAGVRVGTRGAGVSVNTSGRRTASVGVPGSGLGYSKSWSNSTRARSAPAPVASPPAPKPGLMAPGYEKAFYKAVQAFTRGDADDALRLFKESSEKDTKDRALANNLFVGIISAQVHQDDDAIAFLERVVTSERSLPDELMEKYVPGGGIELPVTESLSVEVLFGSLAAALVLAEVYQRNGRLDDAIGLLQQLVDVDSPDPFLIASLCDLYAEQEAWDEIVEVAAGTTNDDDASLQVRVFQARALQEQGMKDAALEVYKDALKTKKRDPDLLQEARYGRGRLYIDLGKRAQGRKDLEKVYAEDPSFRDVRELLDGAG